MRHPSSTRLGASRRSFGPTRAGGVDPSSTRADTYWLQLLWLHDALADHWPTPVVAGARAVALAQARGPRAGLAALDEIPSAHEVAGWPWLPAAQAKPHRRAGHLREAARNYRLALRCPPRLQRRLDECLSELGDQCTPSSFRS